MDMRLSKIWNFLYLSRKNMLDFWHDIWMNMFFRLSMMIVLIVNVCLWFVSYQIKKMYQENNLAILNYNVDFGIKLYDSANKIFFLPLLGLVFALLNTFLLFILRKNTLDKKFYRYIVLSFTLFLEIILFISVLCLYLVNFNQ